jgi:pyrroline-5-carboxylate reductase
MATKALFIGAGNIGVHVLRAFEAAHPDWQIFLHTKTAPLNFASTPLANTGFNYIFLLVKPQTLHQVSKEVEFAKLCMEGTLVVSIMAGLECAAIRQKLSLPNFVEVARVMPTISIATNQGVSGIFCANYNTLQVETVERVFARMGLVFKLATEDLMHNFTACVGSGVGFALQIMTNFAQTVQTNLPFLTSQQVAEITQNLFCQTLQNLQHPQAALSKIASKGGTTQAGLDILQNHVSTLPKILQLSVLKAVERSVELGKNISNN